MRRPVEHRYFFALLPPPLRGRQILAWANEQGARELQEAERLHATLAITPDFPAHQPDLVTKLLKAAQAVRAAPLDLVLDQRNSNGRNMVLRPSRTIPALKALNAAIVQEMRREGVGLRPGWKFRPHVTLTYSGSGSSGAQAVHDMGWPVSEFVLVHSYVNLHRHDILGRWSLEPMPEAQLSLFAA